MPQLCTICTHPERKEIDLAIIRGDMSNRRIGTHFEVGEKSVRYHRKEHLAAILQRAQLEQMLADKIDCNAELAKCFERINRLFDACHEWLTDADNPEKYFLGPRS